MAKTTVPIELSSTPSIVDNGNATAITIDSSENIGIGVSPTSVNGDKVLEMLSTTGSEFIGYNNTAMATGELVASFIGRNDDGSNAGSPHYAGMAITSASIDGNMNVDFYSGISSYETFTNPAMRIDYNGNLLVGTNSSTTPHLLTSGSGGAMWNNSLYISIGRTSDSLFLNRLGSDGGVARFYKDGVNKGSISVDSIGTSYNSNGGIIYIGGDQSNHIQVITSTASGTPRLQPSADNTVDLGTGSTRFDDVFATNGTIQTSDRNEKQDEADLSDAETRVAVAAKGLLKKFRWKSAVEEKGDEARVHFGIIAQDLQDAFAAEGLDASDYAMFISSTWTDEETGEERTRLGVRYSELLAFIIAGI